MTGLVALVLIYFLAPTLFFAAAPLTVVVSASLLCAVYARERRIAHAIATNLQSGVYAWSSQPLGGEVTRLPRLAAHLSVVQDVVFVLSHVAALEDYRSAPRITPLAASPSSVVPAPKPFFAIGAMVALCTFPFLLTTAATIGVPTSVLARAASFTEVQFVRQVESESGALLFWNIRESGSKAELLGCRGVRARHWVATRAHHPEVLLEGKALYFALRGLQMQKPQFWVPTLVGCHVPAFDPEGSAESANLLYDTYSSAGLRSVVLDPESGDVRDTSPSPWATMPDR